MLEEITSINKWIKNVNLEHSSLDICQVEDIVYRLPSGEFQNDQNINDENIIVKGTKGNKTDSDTIKSKEVVSIESIIKPKLNEFELNTDIHINEDYEILTECSLPTDYSDTTATYYKDIKNLGKIEYWKFNDKNYSIENRLQPQKFHHHVLQPRLFKNNDNEIYTYNLNLECPKSATDSELDNYNLLKNPNIKHNAMTYRYSRQMKNKEISTKVEYLCRMCSFKRWIPKDRFYEHMGLAHGILLVENLGYISLPPPDALFRMSPGKLKCYYCKCPKCWKWLRLGKLTGIKNISVEIQQNDDINDDLAVVGLYTNYFMHFYKCSQDS